MHGDSGWIGTLTFRDIRRDSILEGLNVTSHSLAHLAIVSRSMLSNCAITLMYATDKI